MEDTKTLHKLCELVGAKLEECYTNLRAGGTMSVSDVDLLDKLAHTQKCLKTTIAMIEAEDEDGGGMSRRYYPASYEGGMSGRRMSRDGGSYDNGGGSYDGDGGMSNRRGRSPSTGRYVSREGRSMHDGIEDIMMDLREMLPHMPEEKKRELERMIQR